MTLKSVNERTSMENKIELSLLIPMRREKRKLTYVGMLIATTREEMKQGGPILGFLSS